MPNIPRSLLRSVLYRVRIEMGAVKLKKQEEACEILSSSAGSQSVGRAGVWLFTTAAT